MFRVRRRRAFADKQKRFGDSSSGLGEHVAVDASCWILGCHLRAFHHPAPALLDDGASIPDPIQSFFGTSEQPACGSSESKTQFLNDKMPTTLC